MYTKKTDDYFDHFLMKEIGQFTDCELNRNHYRNIKNRNCIKILEF